MAYPRFFYSRDPAEIYEQLEGQTCKGCRHIGEHWGRIHCTKGRPLGRKCKSYDEAIINKKTGGIA